jgi:hypothetical protein
MKTLDWAVKSGEVKLQDFFYPIGSVTGNIAGAEMAWKYYQDVGFSFLRTCVLLLTIYTLISIELRCDQADARQSLAFSHGCCNR